MSRSDGKFPSYLKLKLDPNDCPDDYWDKSYKCPGCDIRWPAVKYFSPSPCCGKPCRKSEREPDFTWSTAVHYLFNARFEKFYEEFNEGKSDQELIWDELRTDNVLDANKVDQAIKNFVDDASKDHTPQ